MPKRTVSHSKRVTSAPLPRTQRIEGERRTRKSRIDPKLTACGWQIVPFEPARPLPKYSRHAVEEYPTANGPADYALVVDGQLLGVVEAKKVTLGPQNVLTQAERYSKGIDGNPFDFRPKFLRLGFRFQRLSPRSRITFGEQR